MMKNINKLDYTDELSECLEYTSRFTASIAIFFMLDLGIIQFLKGRKEASLYEIADSCKLEIDKLYEFLLYASNEGILENKNKKFLLTDLGRKIYKSRGWFEMLVGGYGETYFQIGDCLTGKKKYASRNTKYVSKGSCNISRYDAIPLTRELMSLEDSEENLILDLGCGNGLYLSLFCEEIANINAIGVEPSTDSYNDAVKEIEKKGMQNRVTLFNSGAIDFFKNYEGRSPDFILFAFVLHEILEQSGFDELTNLLVRIKETFPKSKLIIIEVDQKISEKEIMKNGIEKLYYNPYYLIHTITEQRLEALPFWRKLFTDVGYEITNELTVDEKLDASRLEVGFLLTPLQHNNN